MLMITSSSYLNIITMNFHKQMIAKTLKSIREDREFDIDDVARSMVQDAAANRVAVLRNLPPLYEHVMKELFSEDDCQGFDVCKEEIHEVTIAEPASCQYFGREPLEQSNWWRRYLATAMHKTNASNPSHPKGKEFRSEFGVPFEIFASFVSMTVEKGWYDPLRIDAIGRKCSDINLLILGVLHTIVGNCTHVNSQTNTNISAETHRVFHRYWLKVMNSI
jgi:hypothetical protein